MTERRDAVERALVDLTEKANEEDCELDESFYTELRNYARHEKVEDLDDDTLQKVIHGLGERAMRSAPGSRAGGGAVRMITFQLCREPFGDCSHAAARILREDRGITTAPTDVAKVTGH
jgi:hypothetical protein